MRPPIEIHRSSVQTWECDQMGHFNVQFYVDRAMQGLAALGIHLGLPPRALRERGARLDVAEQHIRFLRELRPGAPFFVHGGIAAIPSDGRGLRVVEELVASASGEPAATFVAECRLVDARSREVLDLPAEALSRAADLAIDVPEHARPRGLAPHAPRPRPRLDEADRLGMFRVYQGVVDDAQCDAHGFMTARHYMGAVSSAIPNLILEMLGVDRSGGRVGGAALEYRFVYHSVPRGGDVLAQRSGLVQVGDKAYTLCHWLFDLATGDAVATAEAVAITMDLDARRAIAIPDEMRRRLEGLVIPGLGL